MNRRLTQAGRGTSGMWSSGKRAELEVKTWGINTMLGKDTCSIKTCPKKLEMMVETMRLQL